MEWTPPRKDTEGEDSNGNAQGLPSGTHVNATGLAAPPPVQIIPLEERRSPNSEKMIDLNEVETKSNADASDQNAVPVDGEEIKYICETLDVIDGIITGIEALRKYIDNFSGSSTQDKEYVYLEEMLIRATVSLDNIETQGHIILKRERKNAVQYVQRLMKILDCRLKENKRNIRYYEADSDDDY